MSKALLILWLILLGIVLAPYVGDFPLLYEFAIYTDSTYYLLISGLLIMTPLIGFYSVRTANDEAFRKIFRILIIVSIILFIFLLLLAGTTRY